MCDGPVFRCSRDSRNITNFYLSFIRKSSMWSKRKSHELGYIQRRFSGRRQDHVKEKLRHDHLSMARKDSTDILYSESGIACLSYFHPLHYVIMISRRKLLNFHCTATTQDGIWKIGRDGMTCGGVVKKKKKRRKLWLCVIASRAEACRGRRVGEKGRKEMVVAGIHSSSFITECIQI